VPHLDGEILAAERLEGEFTEVPDALDVDVSRSCFGDLFEGLMMGCLVERKTASG